MWQYTKIFDHLFQFRKQIAIGKLKKKLIMYLTNNISYAINNFFNLSLIFFFGAARSRNN